MFATEPSTVAFVCFKIKVLPIYSAAPTFYNSDWNTWYDYDWNGLNQLVFCRRGYLQTQSIMLLCPQIQMAHAWIFIPDFKNHPRTAVAVWGGVDFIYHSLFCSFRAFYCNRRRAYLNIFYIFPICFQILTFFILLLMFVLLCPDVKIISCGGQYHNTRVFPKKVFVILLNVH